MGIYLGSFLVRHPACGRIFRPLETCLRTHRVKKKLNYNIKVEMRVEGDCGLARAAWCWPTGDNKACAFAQCCRKELGNGCALVDQDQSLIHRWRWSRGALSNQTRRRESCSECSTRRHNPLKVVDTQLASTKSSRGRRGVGYQLMARFDVSITRPASACQITGCQSMHVAQMELSS